MRLIKIFHILQFIPTQSGVNKRVNVLVPREVLGIQPAAAPDLTQKHFGCDGNLLHPEFFHLFKFNFLFSSTHKTIYHSADYPVSRTPSLLPIYTSWARSIVKKVALASKSIPCPLFLVFFIIRSIAVEPSIKA